MTSREHFERWMKHSRPNMSLDWDEQEGYYYHDIVHLMFAAWKGRENVRPTENSRITKEQLAEDHPETLVDRLNGIYQDATYPVTPLQREAAREIERLRGFVEDVAEKIKRCDYTQARSDALSLLALNKKPAEAG